MREGKKEQSTQWEWLCSPFYSTCFGTGVIVTLEMAFMPVLNEDLTFMLWRWLRSSNHRVCILFSQEQGTKASPNWLCPCPKKVPSCMLLPTTLLTSHCLELDHITLVTWEIGRGGALLFFLKSWEHCYPNKINVLAVIESDKQSLLSPLLFILTAKSSLYLLLTHE